MKQITALAFLILISGCVTRTITEEPQNRGAQTGGKFGAKSESKTVEKKTVWIWQKEFRNP
jgi:hypothetical protein